MNQVLMNHVLMSHDKKEKRSFLHEFFLLDDKRLKIYIKYGINKWNQCVLKSSLNKEDLL